MSLIFSAQWKQYTNMVEAMIEESFFKLYDGTLRDAMRYSTMAGGKRLRPALLLAACQLCGGDAPLAVPFAAAIEMVHTYSLIHDDLPAMDDDVLRRGQETCHVKFGEAVAILAGDALQCQAFECMLHSELSAKKPDRVIKAMRELAGAAGARGMVAGQAADLESEGRDDVGSSELAFIHTHKTAALIRAAVLMGAHIAGETNTQALETYAANVGMAFQIQDDILDATSCASEIGKSAGKDKSAGKLTYVKVYGLNTSRDLSLRCTEAAIAALRGYHDADFLVELARFLHTRNN